MVYCEYHHPDHAEEMIMGEVFDSLNTGLKGTAFEPSYVILVAFVALVIWLLTKKN